MKQIKEFSKKKESVKSSVEKLKRIDIDNLSQKFRNKIGKDNDRDTDIISEIATILNEKVSQNANDIFSQKENENHNNDKEELFSVENVKDIIEIFGKKDSKVSDRSSIL